MVLKETSILGRRLPKLRDIIYNPEQPSGTSSESSLSYKIKKEQHEKENLAAEKNNPVKRARHETPMVPKDIVVGRDDISD